MVTPEQKDYVAKQRANGVADEDIAKSLLEHGYSDTQIAELLSKTDDRKSKKASFMGLTYSPTTVRNISVVGGVLLVGYTLFWIYFLPSGDSAIDFLGFSLMILLMSAPFIILPLMILSYLFIKIHHRLQDNTNTRNKSGSVTNHPLNFLILLIILALISTIFPWSQYLNLLTSLYAYGVLFLFFLIVAGYKTYTTKGLMRYALAALLALALIFIFFGLLLL